MYKIFLSNSYNKSLKKIKKSGKYFDIVKKIEHVIGMIASGEGLPKKYKDHKLHGKFSDFRECHIKSDLLLIYKKDKEKLILVVVNIGNHGDLFK